GIESTVVSIENAEIVLLRPGMVSIESLREFGPVRVAEGQRPDEPQAAPGQHARHYSPRTPLFVGAPDRPGRGAYVWWNVPAEFRESIVPVHLPGEPAQYAARLYHALHDLDAEHLDWIAVEPLPPGLAWDAIRDRLRRASTRS